MSDFLNTPPPTPQPMQLLVLTAKHPELVASDLQRHLGDCEITTRQVNISDLSKEALRVIASAVGDQPGMVLVDHCYNAVLLYIMIAFAHRPRFAVITEEHPGKLPLSAINLDTGHHTLACA